MELPADIVARGVGPGPCLGCQAHVEGRWRLCQTCRENVRSTRLQALEETDRALLERERAERKAAVLASVPKKFADARVAALPTDAVGYEAIARLAAGDPEWVFVVGGPGAGKTWLAVALLRAWLQPFAMFVTGTALAQARQEHPLGAGPPQLIQQAKSATLLVVDDLGGISSPHDSAVADVIVTRDGDALPTIVTSAHPPSALAQKFGLSVANRLSERSVIIPTVRRPEWR